MKTAVALTALLMTTAAHAGQAADVAKQWGLIGKWAVSCPDGQTISYEIEPDGRLISDNGTKAIDEIQIASVNEEKQLILGYISTREQVQRTLIIDRKGDTIRPVLNRNSRNEYTVRDSKFEATGQETAWLQKCR